MSNEDTARPPTVTSDDLGQASAAESRAFARLLGLIRRLRGPGGCSWDRKQTLNTMTPYIIEETYEVIDAIERNVDSDVSEELGDLIFLLFFCLEIAGEEQRFRLEDTLESHVTKMIGRHPHVFGDTNQLGSDQAARQWEEIKQGERRQGSSILAGRLPGLPALTGAFRVQEKASAVGFDWEYIGAVLDKVEEEVGELRAELRSATAAGEESPGAKTQGGESAGGKSSVDESTSGESANDDARSDAARGNASGRQRAELGDLLFSIVNVARFLAIDPEAALRGTTGRFISRFHHIEEQLGKQGRKLTEASLAEMDALWEEAKRLESEAEPPAATPRRDDSATA